MKYIVAKYKEDTSWTDSLDGDVHIIEKEKYSKILKKSLENNGRESSTYLEFIISQYDTLDGYYCFLQGNPFEHCDNIPSLECDFMPIGKYFIPCDNMGNPHHPNLPVGKYYEMLFGKDIFFYSFLAGAQFIVSSSRITSRPKDFYEKLLSLHSTEPLMPWIMERLWGYILSEK